MSTEPQIIRNAARCLKCNTVIESRHRHDWVACECWDELGAGIFVDGGHDYLRRGGNPDEFEDLSEMSE